MKNLFPKIQERGFLHQKTGADNCAPVLKTNIKVQNPLRQTAQVLLGVQPFS